MKATSAALLCASTNQVTLGWHVCLLPSVPLLPPRQGALACTLLPGPRSGGTEYSKDTCPSKAPYVYPCPLRGCVCHLITFFFVWVAVKRLHSLQCGPHASTPFSASIPQIPRTTYITDYSQVVTATYFIFFFAVLESLLVHYITTLVSVQVHRTRLHCTAPLCSPITVQRCPHCIDPLHHHHGLAAVCARQAWQCAVDAFL